MKIFISSTSVDLKEHRRAAAEALERSGYEFCRMETFGARPSEPTAACFQEIANSDVVVGIYAHRYGFVPSGCPASITEQEYEYARHRGKPVFCFLLDHDYPWPPKMIDNEEPAKSTLLSFKKKLRETMTVDWFTSPEDLSVKITTSLSRYLRKEDLKKTALQLPQGALDPTFQTTSVSASKSYSMIFAL